MGGCACKGIKVLIAGALLVINHQAWLWSTIDAWLLVGILLMVAGAMKAVWPCCPVHGCGPKPAVASKKGRR